MFSSPATCILWQMLGLQEKRKNKQANVTLVPNQGTSPIEGTSAHLSFIVSTWYLGIYNTYSWTWELFQFVLLIALTFKSIDQPVSVVPGFKNQWS